MIEFKEFPKIARLNREVIVTEKIDGTNAAVVIEDGLENVIEPMAVAKVRNLNVYAQSRSKIITTKEDNHGFARWVAEHAEELCDRSRGLGVGAHFGEWWGHGIQRNYGLTEKRFSLFNVSRWADDAVRPVCCHIVPEIMRGTPSQGLTVAFPAMEFLRANGSLASPGFMKPEGIVCFHVQGNLMFKATIEKDEEWKGKSNTR